MADADVNLNIRVNKGSATNSINDFVKDANSSITQVVKSYGAITVAAAAVGVAIKEAFDTAEQIANIADETNKVNKQFDFLANAAGGSSAELRAAFENINQGILDTEDILKSASVALVNLNIPAQDIAKNFEAARKLSIGLGVDTQQAFEAINTAISSGNTRVLRQIGLFVDSKAAVDKYAESIGVSAKFLTDAQKETALFNAIQEKVAKNFSNVEISTKTTSESFKEFSTSAQDVGESVAIALNKIFGPSVQGALSSYSELFRRLGNEIMSRYGSEAEKAAAKSDLLATKLKQVDELKALIARSPEFALVKQPELQALEKSISLLQAEKQAIADREEKEQDAHLKFATRSQERTESTAKEVAVNAELVKAKQDYATKVLGLESSVAQAAFQRAADEQGIQEAAAVRRLQLEQETNLKILENRRAAAEVGLLGTSQQLAAEQAIKDQARLAEEQLDSESNQRVLDAKTNAAVVSGELSTQGGLKTLQFQKEIVDKQLAEATRGSAEEARLKKKSLELEQQISQQKVAAASQALGNLSTLMQTNSKELFAIGKAAAIADATIRGFQAFNLALATIPPPFGAIVGATSLAAAAVQISKIGSTNLATGITEVPTGFPNDSFPANLTSGERVLSVAQNQDLTEFLKKQDGGESSVASDDTNELLAAILNRLGTLENTIVVNIGNREIVREVREGLRSGQVLTA